MKLNLKEIALFSMLGSMMYVSKLLMEALPNVHLLGVFIVAFTVVYRAKALYPIYIYVFIFGLFSGFPLTWIPNLYIWTLLWGAVMLLPKNMPKAIKPIVYMAVCALHGFLFGILYAPSQALLFGYDFNQTVAWMIVGFVPWDIIHGVSNFFCGILISPIIYVLKNAKKYM